MATRQTEWRIRLRELAVRSDPDRLADVSSPGRNRGQDSVCVLCRALREKTTHTESCRGPKGVVGGVPYLRPRTAADGGPFLSLHADQPPEGGMNQTICAALAGLTARSAGLCGLLLERA